MAFSNITRIILYVVAGISLLVILFFYASPKTVDMDDLEMRVEEMTNPVDLDLSAPLPVADSASADSTAVAEAPSPQQGAQNVISTADVNLRDNMTLWEYLVYFRTDIALIWAYILLALTAIAAIAFPLIHVASTPKALLRLGLVLAAAAVLVVISYLFASETPIDIIGYTGESNRDPGTLKMVDTTLFVTYMLFGLAILSILYSIISRVFK